MRALDDVRKLTPDHVMKACKQKDAVWLSRYYQYIRKSPEWQKFVRMRTLERTQGAELFD